MTDRMPNAFAAGEPAASAAPSAASEIEAATRRLAAALDGLESAVERRREYDRGSDELAARTFAYQAGCPDDRSDGDTMEFLLKDAFWDRLFAVEKPAGQ